MLRLGDAVRYRGRTFVVAGYRPRSQADNRVLLEHVLSREQLWVDPGEVEQLDEEEEQPGPRLFLHDRLEQAG